MIEASSDACSVIITVKSLINLSAYTLSTSRPDNAIAVTGLACFTVTAAVSPIAGQSEIDYTNIYVYITNFQKPEQIQTSMACFPMISSIQ